MSYIINKTNGDVLTEIVDGTIDQLSTNLTLVGKNASSYGEAINENFVHVLENFANTTSPVRPIQGQLWYDTSQGRLKIYDGSGWKVSSGTVVSANIPTLAQGDIWIDSTRQQLYFNDGSQTLLAGPIYTAQQGTSGFNVIDVVDTNQITHTIVMMYVGGSLLGIFAKTQFTPVSPIVGWSGPLWSNTSSYSLNDRVIYVVNGKPLAFEAKDIATTGNFIGRVPPNTLPTDSQFWRQIFINPGFNSSVLRDVKFNVPVTQADSLLASDGTSKSAENFLSTTDENTTAVGSVVIQNNVPLKLGPQTNNEIQVDTSNFKIVSNSINQNFSVVTLGNSGLITAIRADALNNRIGIFTDVPEATLDVAGDVRITGNLTVEGLTTTFSSSNLIIEDKQIELGKVSAIATRSGNISSNSTSTTITGMTSVVGIIPGMLLTKITGTGEFGSNSTVVSVDSDTQITIISDTPNAQGSIQFSIGGATDLTANGGGFSLEGATPKTFTWIANNNAWTSSEHINLESGKDFMINGFDVITSISSNTFGLGVTVTSAPGLTSVGTLTSLQVSYLGVSNSTVSYINPAVTDGNITLVPKGAGAVDVSNKRIINVADPDVMPSGANHAVNLSTLDYTVKTYPQAFSINQGVLTNAQIAANIVTTMCPPSEHVDDANVRVWCLDTLVAKQFTLVGGTWEWTADL
jgi:hypothetical protein